MSYTYNRNDCLKWLAKPNVNPKTGRKIDPESKTGVYNQLKTQCGKLGLLPDKITDEIRKEMAEMSETVESSKPTSTQASSSSSGQRKLPVVKKGPPLWPNMTRVDVLALAGRVLAEDPEAQTQALALHQSYCDQKNKMNDLFQKWKQTGQINKDDELALAGDFLSRFCRCLLDIKAKNQKRLDQLEKQIKATDDTQEKAKLQAEVNNMASLAFGRCKNSIYNNRGLKGVATQGSDKIECDDVLARAENTIKSVGGTCGKPTIKTTTKTTKSN